MGFYGNITNTSRTQFQFDKIYFSRKQMDDSAATDGIYAGRYVLVNYEQDDNEAGDYYLNAYKMYDDETQEFYFCSSINDERLTRFRYVESQAQADPDNDLVYKGQIIAVPPDGLHNVVDPEATKWEFWVVTGSITVVEQTETVPDPELTQYDNPDEVEVEYATYTQYTGGLYTVNYNTDVDEYGTSRGYDSTVWQKVYKEGQDKYVMVAELNTIVPTFDIEADAPKMVPLTPHFDADSTNVYYKLHWSPSWGLRVRAASSKLRGPILKDSGADSGVGLTPMTTGTIDYPSDERAEWYKTVYDGINTTTDYAFTVDEYHDTGRWIPVDESMRQLNTDGTAEAVMGPPAAIYYNKDGFKADVVSYGYFERALTADTYQPYTYYKKVDGKYVLVDDLDFNQNLTYYEKIDDHIRVQPTGISGHMYNRHDGSVTDAVQEDTQEITIMLPAIGNSIAAIWDLIYGSEEVNGGERRNMDIEWERARAGMDRHGLRLVTDFDFTNQYLYKTKNVDTVAGAINSVHDLLGMIITSAPHDNLMNSINQLSNERIYYDETNHTFNRKHIVYTYEELSDESYEFESIGTLTADQYEPGYYYYEVSEDEYAIDHGVSPTSGREYFLRAILEDVEYTPVNDLNLFDGTVYCYPDFIGTDDHLYSYEEVQLDANSYEPNFYYKYENSNYVLATSELFNAETTYFRKTSVFDPLKLDYVREPEYQRDRIYYRWDEIQKDAYPTLSDIYEKNMFYYKDEQGNFILSQSDTAETAIQYYTLLPENIKTLRSLFPEGQYFGLYVPGKYLYRTQEGNYKLAVAATLAQSLAYENTANSPYYILNTSNQMTLDNQVYSRVITFDVVNLNVDTYIKDVYYIKRSNAPENTNSESDFQLCSENDFDQAKTYYIRNETLYLVNNNYYQVDETMPYNLIQFHEHEFYYRDGHDYKVVPRIAETALLTSDDIVVFRNHPNNGREENEPNGGTYILNPQDYSRPAVSAMIYQDQFYETGKFHYLHEDFEPIELDADTYEADKYYIYDDVNQEYVLADSVEWDSEASYFADYSDLILDTYPRKIHSTYYRIPVNGIGEPVTLKFFEEYRYYKKRNDREYVLITEETPDVLEQTIYERNPLYVMHDEAGIYSDGAIWNFDAHFIPATLTLGRRTESFGLEPFQDFARNLETLNGMLLKVKSMLDYDDKDTRDTRTVQGALHTLQDKIAQFSTWKPGQVMIADAYGRLHGANRVETEWTKINVDPQVGVPTIHIEHKYNPIANTTSTTDLSIDNSASFNDIKTIRDGTGHEVATHTTNIIFPNSYGIVGADNTTFTPNNASNTHDIPADGTYNSIKFEGTDQWIQTATAIEMENAGTANEVSVKKIKFTHEYNRDVSRDQTPTPNLSLNADAKITDHYPQLDAMGHVVAWVDTTYDLPDSYGIVGADNTTFTPNNTNNINDIAAGTTYQAIKFEGTDDWIQTQTATETEGEGANAVAVKKIKFTHEYNRDTSRDVTTNINLATSTTAAFTDWKPLLDANGHVVAWENSPITFPNGYSQFTGDSGTSQAADTYDSFKFEGSTWVETTVDGTNQKITIGHKNPVTNGATAVGPTVSQSPSFGGTFSIPAFAIDSKGHVATTGTQTVTIPQMSVTSGTNSTTDSLLTGLSYNDGIFTTTSIAPQSMVLTGYTSDNTVTIGAITASDTIGSALNMLEQRIIAAETSAGGANSSIAGLNVSAVTAGTGEVISEVSQSGGRISVSKKNLTANDIPSLTASKISDFTSYSFSYTPSGKSTAETFSLQTIIDRLVALEDAQA